MTGTAVSSGVARMRDAVDTLLSAPVDGLASAELTSVLAELQVQRNRLAAVDQRVIAALGSSGAVLESGSTSLPDLVSGLTRCSRGEARARVGRAVDLGPRRAVSGEPLEPIHPAVAAGVADGAVSEAQSEVIIAALGRIGADAEPHAFEVAERFLVDAARVQPPAALARSAAWVLAQLDPAGLEPAEKTAERSRSFFLSEQADADGCVLAKGRLTPETAAALRAVLGALGAPRPVNAAGERDPRSAGQRQHDALLEMALRLLRSGNLPDTGGVTTSVNVSLRDLDVSDLVAKHDGAAHDGAAHDGAAHDGAAHDGAAHDGAAHDGAAHIGAPKVRAAESRDDAAPGGVGRLLARLSGVGQLGDGGPISLCRLRPLFDECEITTVVLSATGGVLDYGRERRIATPAMRRALAARDGGCCFPGCDRPPEWCQAHHVWAWIDGGPTCLENLCLLCSYHHRMFGPAGWQVVMRDGVPVWIPPPWLDPQQRELTNTVRHLPCIDFGGAWATEVLRT